MTKQQYRSTDSKYKGGARAMYVTYDLEQATRVESTTMFPKVHRVYIAGDVEDWRVGTFTKIPGREVFGVRIDYEQRRAGFDREGYTAKRADTGTEYEVAPTHVDESVSKFSQIVELPDRAQNVQFFEDSLPEKYQSALQNAR